MRPLFVYHFCSVGNALVLLISRNWGPPKRLVLSLSLSNTQGVPFNIPIWQGGLPAEVPAQQWHRRIMLDERLI